MSAVRNSSNLKKTMCALCVFQVNPSGNNSDVLRGASIRSTDSNDSIDPNDPQSATVYETSIVGGVAVKTKKVE